MRPYHQQHFNYNEAVNILELRNVITAIINNEIIITITKQRNIINNYVI